ncbi:hypothetical protein GCM10009117_15890 [Gangjinia marincola]|uniref:Trimeric autotransporter adhesin YadA-like head domain-containing protein n=2 Tax=Gangjinia marincola TaxID=578463 RepID=A0ABN1MGY1_9FLAO
MFVVILFCPLATHLIAQVGINTTDPKALLDIQSSNTAAPSHLDGILIPKMDNAPETNPTEDQDGMMVYMTGNGSHEKGFYFWDHTAASWQSVYKGSLRAINEGNGIGYRLAEKNPESYGNIGALAVDLSHAEGSTNLYGALGNYSFAVGSQNKASGLSSIALGRLNTASGSYSNAQGTENSASGFASFAAGLGNTASNTYNIALGNNNTAEGTSTFAIGNSNTSSGSNSFTIGRTNNADGTFSFSIGNDNTASGDRSFTIGSYNTASSFAQMNLGRFSTLSSGNPTSWVSTDRLFALGNGLNESNRSDALVVLKNGTITAPSFDVAEISDDKALITKEYFDANNNASLATGLEAIDEGNGIGWRLAGKNPESYGDIGFLAIDLSHVVGSTNLYGALGSHSFVSGGPNIASGSYSIALGRGNNASASYSYAQGNENTASGFASFAAGIGNTASNSYNIALGNNNTADGTSTFAIGNSNTSSGSNSFAMGRTNNAEGTFSFSIGNDNTASGNRSLTIGTGNTASSFAQMNIGINSTISSGNPTSWISTDRLFVLGNGVNNSLRSDALVVLKNGTITAPSLDLSEITDDKALITKEYFDANNNASFAATGLEAIDEGNGIGWRLIGRNPESYADIGRNAIDFSNNTGSGNTFGAKGDYAIVNGFRNIGSGTHSLVLGNDSFATSDHAVAIGFANQAAGSNSLALGNSNTADNSYSIALGRSNSSEGNYALTIGEDNNSTGDHSISMGNTNEAIGNGSLAIGTNNAASSYAQINLGINSTLSGGNASSFIATDRLFVLGNGTNSGARSDALIILKNGTITAPSFNLSEINDDKALITKEYADLNYSDGTGTSPANPINITSFGPEYFVYGGAYEQPRYYKDRNRVYLEGLVARTSSNFVQGEVLFTLPVGYRPAKRQLFSCRNGSSIIRVDIFPNGEMRYSNYSNGSADWVSLSGVSFLAN